MTDMRLTSHAAARLAERGLTMPIIQAVIEHGEVIREDAVGAERRSLNGYVVVIQGKAVVTAWPPASSPSKRNPKRSARSRGQQFRDQGRERRFWTGALW